MNTLLHMTEAGIKSNIDHYERLRDQLVVQAVDAELMLHKYNIVLSIFRAKTDSDGQPAPADAFQTLLK